MDTFHNWGTTYKIEFDIKINGPIAGADLNGYVNIFHMSTLKPGESETGTLYILESSPSHCSKIKNNGKKRRFKFHFPGFLETSPMSKFFFSIIRHWR